MARALDLPGSSLSEKDDYRRDPCPSNAQLIRAAMRDHVTSLGDLPRLVWDTAKGVRRVRRKSTSAPGLARNFHPPETFLNHVVSPGRTFASATLGLADVKGIGKELGVTINDMVLAISTGALRTLLLRYDGHADEPLLCGVPLCTDTSPERISGNAIGTIVVFQSPDKSPTRVGGGGSPAPARRFVSSVIKCAECVANHRRDG